MNKLIQYTVHFARTQASLSFLFEEINSMKALSESLNDEPVLPSFLQERAKRCKLNNTISVNKLRLKKLNKTSLKLLF